ncbi:MAG TPA: DUF1361 domain-containing protein [Candidatus Kapabacteria bacterium]|nr:DUF1361 domain-containing protein [Candidatus Kapabacteria bacterium]
MNQNNEMIETGGWRRRLMARVRVMYSDRVVTSLATLGVSTVLCIVMVAVRVMYTGTRGYSFLVWNLFLAWIPFLIALGLYIRRRRSTWSFLLAGCLWLLFFPNAPYIVTDLIHVRWTTTAPIWYDVTMIAACAWTGLLLGLTSLRMMQSLVRQQWGKIVSWAFAFVVMILGSFGVYLGRFQRWNSWDLLSNPSGLVGDILRGVLHPLAHPRPLAMTMLFTLFLIVAYLTISGLAVVRHGSAERES